MASLSAWIIQHPISHSIFGKTVLLLALVKSYITKIVANFDDPTHIPFLLDITWYLNLNNSHINLSSSFLIFLMKKLHYFGVMSEVLFPSHVSVILFTTLGMNAYTRRVLWGLWLSQYLKYSTTKCFFLLNFGVFYLKEVGEFPYHIVIFIFFTGIIGGVFLSYFLLK